MSIKDELIGEYLRLATDYDLDAVERIEHQIAEGDMNPRDAKLAMAKRLVAMYHGDGAAEKAASEFDRVFKERKTPVEMPTLEVPSEYLAGGKCWIVKLLRLAEAADSNSSALNLVRQGAVSLDSDSVDVREPDVEVHSGMILKVGKHRFYRIELHE